MFLITATITVTKIIFFLEPLEVEEWGEEPEEEEEGDEEEEEEEGVGGEEGGGDGDLQEYADPLQVDEDSTDVSRETSNYTQVWSFYVFTRVFFTVCYIFCNCFPLGVVFVIQ